jgi:hypothetical protein
MGTSGTFMTGSSTSSGMMGPQNFYLHTGKALYTLPAANPSAAPTLVGDLSVCLNSTSMKDTSMTDIAVSSSGDVWMTSYNYAYHLQINGSTITCPQTINLPATQFVGLTFAPVGVLDPNNEVLVGGDKADNVWSISPTGAVKPHGTYGTIPANDGQGHNYTNVGQPFQLSGDIVFLSNNGNPVGFATVRDCSSSGACTAVDTLIEIDVPALANAGATTSVRKSIRGQVLGSGGTKYGSMFGISAYQDKVYGFSHTGDIVSISNTNGSATLLQHVTSCSGGMCLWDGAGVSTSVMIIPPM